jgi:hypothetical protein
MSYYSGNLPLVRDIILYQLLFLSPLQFVKNNIAKNISKVPHKQKNMVEIIELHGNAENQ